MSIELRELSKSRRVTDSNTFEAVNAGSLQRIAGASELMAKNHAQLIRERDNYERYYRDEEKRRHALERSLAAMKGVVTKREQRIAELEAELARTREEALKASQ